MNTSHTSTALSAQQLEDFLQGKLSAEETKRVQHLLDDCELSKEALEGYSIVPGAFADVAGLKKSIAAKSGMTSLSWSTIGLSIVAIAALSFAVNVFINSDASPETKVVQTHDIGPDISVAPPPANILSPSEDHFVNPEAKLVSVAVNGETQESGSSGTVKANQEFVVEPIPVDNNKQLIVDSVPVAAKVVASEAYNAQVGFLVNLKITEFDKYYTTQTIAVKELPLTGTSADKENKDDFGDPAETETVRNVPADQFLREGLIAFRDARYGKCISKMEVLLQLNGNDINALFYTAVSYVKLEMYSKAIPLLDKIIADPNNVFDEEAQWYKALALDGNGDTAAAQELFKKISTDGGFYSKQATARLR
jgi:hypothetical protein